MHVFPYFAECRFVFLVRIQNIYGERSRQGCQGRSGSGVRRSYQSDNEQDTDYSRKVIACGDHWEQFIALTRILDSLSGGESIEQDTQHQEEQDHKEL